MNRKWFQIFAVPAVAGGMMFAQTTAPAPSGQPSQQTHKFHRGNRGARMAQFLGLSEAQQEQAKSILKEAHQTAQSVQQQLKADREQMRAAIKANDTAQINQLAAKEGTLMGQLQAIRSSAFAKIYNTVLTPEQRTKADQMPAMFRQHHGQREGRRANG